MALHKFAIRRINNELKQVAKSECGISVEVLNENLTELKAKISGPLDTPYEGGEFILEIKLPKDYPFKPLKIKFITKIWHPNIGSRTGSICLDILKTKWTAAMTIKTVLLSLQALLQDPAPDDPLDGDVANQCQRNPEMFKLTARYWAQLYAGAPGSNPDFDDKVKKLKAIAKEQSDESTVVRELSACSWNLEEAKSVFE